MANNRKIHLDAVEHRLTGPKRIALFGHRNVGKTTLLSMFYRQASSGQIPDVRLAAANPSTAEYLADKIVQIESGESLAGTLAETELHLRLYHGPARFDLIVKDYQGEHVTLGSEEPIQQFFADCDAVFLCLDPEGSTHPAERRRRQQEVENLLEKYIEKSADGMTDRPIALLLTKFDRVMAQAGGSLEHVEKLVDARYGMTRHALSRHAKRGAIFAVSAYGRGSVDGRPPAEIRPIGLEGPLAWLAEQLEAIDRDQLEWLWDLAPNEVSRLARGVAAFERRYPNTPAADNFRKRLASARRKRARGVLMKFTALVTLVVGGLAGYDAWGYQDAVAFEREHPPVAVERRWSDLLTWHPSLAWFWPERASFARTRLAEWKLKADQDRISAGSVDPKLIGDLAVLKTEQPTLAPTIKKVEEKAVLAKQDQRWREVLSVAAASADQPEKVIDAVRDFLRDYPDSFRKAEADSLFSENKAKIAARQSAAERRHVDELIRAADVPNADLTALIEQSRQFLNDYPDSMHRAEVEKLVSRFSRTADDRDIEQARQFSRQFPSQYQARIDKYQAYLKAHAAGGHYIREATEAKNKILRDWDSNTYRLAFDHSANRPNDFAQIAAMLRDYLQQHPEGQRAAAAKEYLNWWDKVSVATEYHVTLVRGEFDPSIGKYLAGGGPDLSVTIEVGGKTFGPSPIIANEYKPIWRYTFPKPIVWKLNDPVSIKVVDHDWSATTVVHLTSGKDDPLALRLLSGTVRPSKGGPTLLVFASDFKVPELPKPE